MVFFTAEELRAAMEETQNIRNLSVIAHVDHGKSTLTDSLLAAAGIISEGDAGTKRGTDNRKDEAERGITIKSTGVSMMFPRPDGEAGTRTLVVNLVDSPGHVDFSSEVTAALRITDGALLVVDCVEGVSAQTETVLRQALEERVKPVLVLNKVDRLIGELQMEPEEVYQRCLRCIESVNALICTFWDPGMGEPCQMDPVLGNVCFASGYYGWGFTLRSFAKIYAPKLGMSVEDLVPCLWGDQYFASNTKTFSNNPGGARARPRSFCKLVWEPIRDLVKRLSVPFVESTEEEEAQLCRMVENLGLRMRESDRNSPDVSIKDLMRKVMRQWLPLHESVLELAELHLPSPAEAQSYRADVLYTGPAGDPWHESIRMCDREGPLVVYVSKMIPHHRQFVAFGRVLGGTMRSNQPLRILGSNFDPLSEGAARRVDCWEAKAGSLSLVMGKNMEATDSVPCGCTVGVSGVAKFLVKTGTLLDADASAAWPVKSMKYAVSPVVRRGVKAKNAADHPSLVDSLKRLSQTDPLVEIKLEEATGAFIIGCAGELHMEILTNDLQEFANIPLVFSDPVVALCETVRSTSCDPCLAKSTNKLNRFWATCEPIPSALLGDMQLGLVGPHKDPKEVRQTLVSSHGWSPDEARKVWGYSPVGEAATNMIVDSTKGVNYINDVRDSVVAAFHDLEGPLCGEPIRGVRFNMTDMLIHSDNSHRGTGQVMPAVKRCLAASVLAAEPALMEPIFTLSISVPESNLGGTYSLLMRRRGQVFDEEPGLGGIIVLRAHLPVSESFGFNSDLRAATSGTAFLQMSFSHWDVVPGNPLEPGTLAHEMLVQTRQRKNMKLEVPTLSSLVDKL